MNILVTGGAGFIGSHLSDRLIQRGDNIIIVDDLNPYYSPEEKKANIPRKASFYQVDITDFRSLSDVFAENAIDKIVHLAARAGVRASLDDPLLYTQVNCVGTLNILELGRIHNVKSIVFASSSSVYGNRHQCPFNEQDHLDEPISPYAATKRIGEYLCKLYHDRYGIKITALRFFTVYGPRGRPDMAPRKFMERILSEQPIDVYGDGTTKRDYTFVSDIVAGITAALDKELDFEIINLGNNRPVELSKFISIIEKTAGKRASIVLKPMQKGDVELTCADITKAQTLLGYNPKVAIEEGMTKLCEWLKASKSL